MYIKALLKDIDKIQTLVSAETINLYLNNLLITLASVPPENFINLDETYISDYPGQ